MNSTTNDDFSDDSNDSFQPIASHRKKKAVIDTDSEESDESISIKNSVSDFSVSQRKSDFEDENSIIEDSLSDNLSLSKNNSDNVTHEASITTDDESILTDDEVFSPIVKNKNKQRNNNRSTNEKNSNSFSQTGNSKHSLNKNTENSQKTNAKKDLVDISNDEMADSDDEVFSPVVKNKNKHRNNRSTIEKSSNNFSQTGNSKYSLNKNTENSQKINSSKNSADISNDEMVNSDDEVFSPIVKNKSKNYTRHSNKKFNSLVQDEENNLENFSFTRDNNAYRENTANNSTDTEKDVKNDISDDSQPSEKSSFQYDYVNSTTPEIIEESLSIVEVSSDEEFGHPVLKQTNLNSFLNVTSQPKKKSPVKPQKNLVSQDEYETQKKKINSLESDLLRTKNAMRIINLNSLPDKGASIINKEKSLNKILQDEKFKLMNMVADDSKPTMTGNEKVEVAWEEIEAGVNAVGPRTFGKKGVARFNVEKQLAVETLDHLHKSLDTCPTENDFVDDPKDLKVPLMPHQRRALAWLLWREKQKPSGGLLADDMGLGKTLTMISLVLKSNELNANDEPKKENLSKYPGGTLVVCPASLMNQWSREIEKRTKRGLLSVELYHGAKRETKAKRLASHDIVITTYGLVLNENEKSGPVFGVRWRRIVLDEAHQIRNHKSQTAESVFRLSGKSKWALTGTPVQNKELDMYAILKFLRCQPFDDLQVWKRWITDKSTGGEMRLQAVISSLMLRRTKAELMSKGTLQILPERKWELISVELDKDEMAVYQKVLLFSKTLFAQFLHQRAEKSQDVYNMKFTNSAAPNLNDEYFKMRNKLLKFNRVKDVSQHEILVLLLRLRQICCHPSLIKQMLNGEEDLGEADNYEDSEELNLLEQLNKMSIIDPGDYLPDEPVNLKEASKGYLNPSNPIFDTRRPSSKTKALIKLLKEKVALGDKVVVVSQWTSLLDLMAIHIKEARIGFDSLNGKIQVSKRMPIVDNFNDPQSDTKVLLLSLTAGGVGLNLVGANHLFLLDLHWNPQLESQAQDRIYRMGQLKPIFVYKFMAMDTIEERVKSLQDKKLEIAEAMLTGSRRVIDNKLSLQDLKMLFEL